MRSNHFIFHIPHSSCEIPSDLRADFCLTDDELRHEILLMTDHFTDKIFTAACSNFDKIIRFPVSRLVVDPERFVDDANEPMSNVGMGAIYIKRHDGKDLRHSINDRQMLLNRFYYPHHIEFEYSVSEHLNSYGKAIIIDCHSYPSRPLPYEINKNGARPDICIGTDKYHTPDYLRDAMLSEFSKLGFTVDINTPFSGTFVPSKFYQSNSSVSSIMIELRRDLYMNEFTGMASNRFSSLKDSVTHALSNIRQYI
jgi:N-formylglutamate deformylase